MLRKLTLPLSVLAMLWSAPAQANLHGCFVRIYDDAHMAKNPAQFIRAIQVQVGLVIGREGDDEADYDIIALKRKGDRKLYYIGLNCELGEGPRNCTTQRTGERITIEETGKGLRMTFETNIRADEEGMGGDVGFDIAKGSDNGVFALAKSSDGHCPYFLNK